MRVLVCGGRNYNNPKKVCHVLNTFWPVSLVIEGGAQGTDCYAAEWADRWEVPHLQFNADWKTKGKAAGPIRNQKMLDEGKPDLVVAFPGGAGTADMVRRAKKAGVEVVEIDD